MPLDYYRDIRIGDFNTSLLSLPSKIPYRKPEAKEIGTWWEVAKVRLEFENVLPALCRFIQNRDELVYAATWMRLGDQVAQDIDYFLASIRRLYPPLAESIQYRDKCCRD